MTAPLEPQSSITLSIDLPTANARQYPIHIGQNLLDKISDILRPHLSRNRVMVISEDTVIREQGKRLFKALDQAGITHETLILTPGEGTKDFSNLQAILTRMIDVGIERQDVVLAFGGGVIGDITGFACSMLRRGCLYVQVPTTLLAQVDSSVGGKTAINMPAGKNLVGAFYQPAAVISDISTLETLSERERKAGYAEIVKYALLGDRSFFDWLEDHGSSVIANDPAAVSHAVEKSCRMKAAIVAEDEREHGRRALLNLGHTFGHVLEAIGGYSDRLLHGEGVSLGMMMAFDFAAGEGFCSVDDVQTVRTHLTRLGCPCDLSDSSGLQSLPDKSVMSADHAMKIMMQDKKVQDGKLTLILPHAIGDAHIHPDVDTNKLAKFWADKM